MLQRRYLSTHVETECPHRMDNCRYCSLTGGHRFIEKEHKGQCPKLPISCPNVCRINKKIAREDMEAHRKECPFEMVQCEYHNVGCDERMMRKRKRKHELENMEKHLLMTKLKLFEETKSSEAKLASAEAKLLSTRSELATTNDRLCKIEVMLHRLIKISGHSNMLIDAAQWPAHLTTLATNVLGVTKISPVIVKMSNFAAKKDKNVSWNSDSFFSHNGGYKMSLNVFPAGDGNGKGTHLSVFLYLTKGPHDDELTWPLRGAFEVKLLNQISDCEHNSITVNFNDGVPHIVAGRVTESERAAGWGKPKFISNEDLNKVTSTCQYLKDDCIFLQVNKML